MNQYEQRGPLTYFAVGVGVILFGVILFLTFRVAVLYNQLQKAETRAESAETSLQEKTTALDDALLRADRAEFGVAVLNQNPLPSFQILKIVNDCREQVSVALSYTSPLNGQTVTEGWWVVEPNKEMLTDARSAENDFYAFGTSKNFRWSDASGPAIKITEKKRFFARGTDTFYPAAAVTQVQRFTKQSGSIVRFTCD